MKYDTIKMQLEQELLVLRVLIEKCEKEGVVNDQFYLDFEDELNKLSTKNHERI